MERQEYSETEFVGQQVLLDGNRYFKCVFRDCEIQFGGSAAVGLDSCQFERCRWNLVAAAGTTMGFLHSIYHGMGESGRQLVEETFDSVREP